MKAREVCLTDPEVVPLFWCQQLLQSGAIGENRECRQLPGENPKRIQPRVRVSVAYQRRSCVSIQQQNNEAVSSMNAQLTR